VEVINHNENEGRVIQKKGGQGLRKAARQDTGRV
jgi:hypothetical protein